ncbi:PVC-type heme-binding CxxCH protein [Chitinophaga sp.]|uniref:PVC-type heme-binding CxxCH protein n=1 Tax=Chitinophaga sp. TaxID=1869181 RepID=UPI0031D196CF
MKLIHLKLRRRLLWGLCAPVMAMFAACSPSGKFDFKKGDRIALIGNGLAERMQYHGFLETYLQAAQPGKELVFRNLGFTGDKVMHRPRAHKAYGDANTHLTRVQANVIFAFFGYNESYDNKPEKFGEELTAWIDSTRLQKYDGKNAPRIVLFSPIAHENLESPNLPDGKDNNKRLEAYTRAMEEVAKAKDVVFVDLFAATQKMYAAEKEPLTINGIHLNEEGNRLVARFITEQLVGAMPRTGEEELTRLRQAVLNKNGNWFNRYRATDGNDVWGGRSELHGNYETLQRELQMLDTITANCDKRIWAIAGGDKNIQPVTDKEEPFWGAWEAWSVDTGMDNSNVPAPVKVESNFKQEVVYLGGEEAISKMHVATGLEVKLFASEEKFPEIANPVTVKRDTKGRLWVAAWESYPKREPLKEMKDQLVILSDTDKDGVADKSVTFARVHNPTGFEFWNNGVIVISAPNILYLKDTDGDDKADVRMVLLGGIDAADTHHAANNLFFGPDGYIYYQRGVFMLCNVETPWGPNQENKQPGLFRFNPRTYQFDFVVENSPNAHGISFDKWGNQFVTDGTTGRAYQVYLDNDGTRAPEATDFKTRRLLKQTVRPVPAHQVLSSQHFPPEYENNFLIYNVIGFQGIKRYKLAYDSGKVWGEEIGDMLYSDDPNFRPTSGVVGEDGALYISDWQNPLIGHMQHNIRDPKRDHVHGRVYRVTAKGRPLSEPVAIAGQPVEKLLDLLKHPVNEVRHQVQIELSGRETKEVIAKAKEWAAKYNADTEDGAHALLEILWLHQRHNVANKELLQQLQGSPVEHAVRAANRVAWFWKYQGKDIGGPAAGHAGHGHGADSGSAAVAAVHNPGPSGKRVDLSSKSEAAVVIGTIPERMLFDTKEIIVKAGQPVKMTLKNVDFMPHNLVVVMPGTADAVAQAAIDLGAEGFKKKFLPDSKSILHATGLLNNNETQTLAFKAPAQPGDYPFLCTFPGHGQLMRGTLKVVK